MPKERKAPLPNTVVCSVPAYGRKSLKLSDIQKRQAFIDLTSLGIFTESQLNSLVFRDTFNSAVLEALKQYVVPLTHPPFNFSSEQLIRIASHKGAAATFKEIYDSFNQLALWGFTVDDVARIANHTGGSNNLRAVIDNFESLEQLNLGSRDVLVNYIVQITNNIGGTQNIAGLKLHLNPLRVLHFSDKEIIDMLSHSGGTNNLVAVIDCFEVLFHGLLFTHAQIVDMVNSSGGYKNIQAVKECFDALIGLKFTHDQIVDMVGRSGGSYSLDAVKKYFESERIIDFSSEEIVKVLKSGATFIGLETIQKFFNKLIEFGFSREQIIDVASHNGGGHNIIALNDFYVGLRSLRFTDIEIYKMANHDGGALCLKFVFNYYKTLIRMKFPHGKIAKLASSDRGSKCLGWIVTHYDLVFSEKLYNEHVSYIINYSSKHSRGMLNDGSQASSGFYEISEVSSNTDTPLPLEEMDGANHQDTQVVLAAPTPIPVVNPLSEVDVHRYNPTNLTDQPPDFSNVIQVEDEGLIDPPADYMFLGIH